MCVAVGIVRMRAEERCVGVARGPAAPAPRGLRKYGENTEGNVFPESRTHHGNCCACFPSRVPSLPQGSSEKRELNPLAQQFDRWKSSTHL